MDQDLTTLQDHTAVLQRRWRVLSLFTVLGLLAGVVVALAQTPVYTAENVLLLENRSVDTTTPADTMDPTEVATQAEVVASDLVANRVIENLGLDTTAPELVETVVVETVDDKRVVLISATRTDAQESAQVANAFADEYVALRADQATQARVAIDSAYIRQLGVLQAQLTELRGRLDGAGPRRAGRLDTRIQSLLARQAELQTSLLLAEDPTAVLVGGGQVLQSAEPPANPSAPQPLLAGLLGLVLGLILGVIVAYIRDRNDDNVHDGTSLSLAAEDAPILGRIPTEEMEHRGRVATLLDSRSPVSEAYRALNTNVRFLLAARATDGGAPAGRGGGLIMVASAGSGEGKTSVATNLAVTAARVGMRVVVVDADLRKPGVAERFGVDLPTGLSDVLSGDLSVEPHLHEVGLPNLRVLGAGTNPPNPAELLASPRTRRVWAELRHTADLVIFDTPPLLRVADALELVRDVDEIILVAREGRSQGQMIQAAVESIRRVGGKPSGTVLNDFAGRSGSYRYGYGHTADVSG